MFQNYFKIAIRNIKKHKGLSIINILGFSVGIAVFILIALYIQYELSFDKYHKNADRIYRIVRENGAFSPAPLGSAMKDKFPEVEAVTNILQIKKILVSYKQKHFLEQTVYWAGPETFKIFTIPFLTGDSATALTNPFSVVLSEKTAKKYFGDENPMGKMITIGDNTPFTVTGVFADMPGNSHFTMNIIVPFADYFTINNWDITRWGGNFCYNYCLLRPGTDVTTLEDKIQQAIGIPMLESYGKKKPYEKVFFLQPITKIHLYSHRLQEISLNNSVANITIFSSVAILILFIACFNYMNLITARSIGRGKEVGVRKVIGAQRKQLVYQFLSESLTMTILAFVLAAIIILLILPYYNNLIERPLNFNPIANPQLFIGLFILLIFVGLFAGSYPAMVISGFKPIVVLRGAFKRSDKGRFVRSVLVVFQFSVTIFLFICTLTINNQLSFMKNVNVGYQKDYIITMDIRDESVKQNIEALERELRQYPDITAVSRSANLPNDIDTHMTRYLNKNRPDEEIRIFYNTADYDFVKLYGIKIVEVRNFSRDFISDKNGVFLVNESAVKEAEWESPIGQNFIHWNGKKGKIVGVMKDFHLHSLHSPIDPLYIFLNPKDYSKLSIKINPNNIPATINYVKDVMKKFSPDYPFEFTFFNELFDRAYHAEEKLNVIFNSFALLAILIACLGLLGLTAFTVEDRNKEIGIRKVMGASFSNITILLSSKFINWVIISNIIAWPVAYYFRAKWLENFSVRVNISIWIFILSGLLTLVIAILTVSMQAAKAAMLNPVDILRNE